MEKNMEGNYLMLYRSMLDWEWYQNTNVKVLFLHMLLKANWKEGKYQGVTVPPGSFVTSLDKLSAETGLSRSAVRCAIEHLKRTGEITTVTAHRFTMINLVNYCIYQCTEEKEQHAKQHADSTQNSTQTAPIEERKNKRNNIKVFDNKLSHTFCTEPEKPDEETAIKIPLNDGTTHNVTHADVERYSELYQGISVMAELRKMVGWCEANTTRRKTRAGVKRFISNWLGKAQDHAPRDRKETGHEPESSAKLW